MHLVTLVISEGSGIDGDLPDFPTLADFSLNNVLKKDRNQSLCVAVVFIVIVDGMRIHVE